MKNYKKIEAYLKGELSPGEVSSFETEIAGNEDLAEEVSLHSFENEILNLGVEDDLRNRIKSIQQTANLSSHASSRVISMKKWLIPLSIAASLLLVIGFFYQNYMVSNEKLVASYYNYSISDLRGDQALNSVFTDGMKLIEEEKFNEAIQSLEKLTRNENFTIQANYLIGHCYFNLENYGQASNYFQSVFNQNEKAGYYFLDAKWNWLLSELAQGKQGKSFDSALDELIEKDYVGAVQLKKDLDSIWR
ncbi:MAG: hypothetical protein KDC85_22535 [Saprospiraceae bacterium]|nr:hypothetical protein [Saprospiraceae bacterium]MCB9324569.1 hypothetical protein [Lewinellaceae bacterium]